MNEDVGLSPKQQQLVEWMGNIEESLCLAVGAIRSGKTYAAVQAFCEWTQLPDHRDKLHLICSQSINVVRSSIVPEIRTWVEKEIEGMTAHFTPRYSELYIGHRKGPLVDTSLPHTRYLVVSGDNEDTYTRLMGVTAHSMLFDELTLVPRNLFVSALGRLSYGTSKCWAMCNPGTPRHWLKMDFIDRGLVDLHLNFTFEDNPWLDERVKERFRTFYIPGSSMYQRYIEGKWVAAEGAIYPKYHTVDLEKIEDLSFRIRRITVGHDHGVTDPCVFLPVAELDVPITVDGKQVHYVTLPALVFDQDEESLTDAQLLDKFMQGYVERWGRKLPLRFVRDLAPVAANFWRELRYNKMRLRFNSFMVSSADRDVLMGIRKTNGLLATGSLILNEQDENLLNEIDGYEWDDRAKRDQPKDGNDHHMDALRYAAMKLGRGTIGRLKR